MRQPCSIPTHYQDHFNIVHNVYFRMKSSSGQVSKVYTCEGGMHGAFYRYYPFSFKINRDGSFLPGSKIKFSSTHALTAHREGRTHMDWQISQVSLAGRGFICQDLNNVRIENIVPPEDVKRFRDGTLKKKLYVIMLINDRLQSLQNSPVLVVRAD